jgi:tetratricopeptide (TPR) repeat protein
MADVIGWVRDGKVSDAKRQARKGMLQAVVNMLADDASFELALSDIQALGGAMVFSNTETIDIARKLSNRQRHSLALALTAAAQRNAPSLAAEYAAHLAPLAEAAGRVDLEKQYLREAWEKPIEAGPPTANDTFAQSTEKLYRLAATSEERETLLRQSWARLQQLPPSGQGMLREARLLGMAGADDACAQRLAQYLSNGFLTAHPFIEPIMGRGLPSGMPSPGPRIDEVNHMRGYWDDVREWGSILQGQGLAPELLTADRELTKRHAGVPLGPKSNYEFTAWRNQALLRQLRFSNPPQRLRILREYLQTDDSVETLIELGSFLEGQGRVRDCVEVYRRLPERAFANVEYCEQFLRVCENSWECGIPIPYIDRLFGAEPQFRPLNLAENLLEEKQALFLARLHDPVRLQLGAFRSSTNARALPGRIPPKVPYLRQLALLLERSGDKPGALAAWEELCEAYPQDEEGGVHRAQLLLGQGNKTRALESVRNVNMGNLWVEPVRQAVRLRVQLAAEAGSWDEVREVMNAICGGTKTQGAPHTGTVILVADELAAHDRAAEAQGLLLRAERAAKDNNDRFRLRLEQLKLLARDPLWQPEHERARIAALARLECTDPDALKDWVEFLGRETQTIRAPLWIEGLASLPPGQVGALGLCAFGSQLSERQASLLPAAWMKLDGSGTVAQRLAVKALLDAGKAGWAHAVATSGRGRALRDQPIMIRVLHALGDKHSIDEIYAGLVRERFPGSGEVVDFCSALAETGRMNQANRLCELALEQQRGIGTSHMPLVHRFARLLIEQRRFEEAETLMMREDDALTVETAQILVELYRGWNKLDRLTQELAKFHLPDGMQSEAEFLAKNGELGKK